MGSLVSGKSGHAVNVLVYQRHAFSFGQGDSRQGAAQAFTHNHNRAAASVPMLFLATIHAVSFDVGRADMTAIVCAINFDMTCQDFAYLDLTGHRFAHFVGQYESGLVVAVQIARKLDHGHALYPPMIVDHPGTTWMT